MVAGASVTADELTKLRSVRGGRDWLLCAWARDTGASGKVWYTTERQKAGEARVIPPDPDAVLLCAVWLMSRFDQMHAQAGLAVLAQVDSPPAAALPFSILVSGIRIAARRSPGFVLAGDDSWTPI